MASKYIKLLQKAPQAEENIKNAIDGFYVQLKGKNLTKQALEKKITQLNNTIKEEDDFYFEDKESNTLLPSEFKKDYLTFQETVQNLKETNEIFDDEIVALETKLLEEYAALHLLCFENAKKFKIAMIAYEKQEKERKIERNYRLMVSFAAVLLTSVVAIPVLAFCSVYCSLFFLTVFPSIAVLIAPKTFIIAAAILAGFAGGCFSLLAAPIMYSEVEEPKRKLESPTKLFASQCSASLGIKNKIKNIFASLKKKCSSLSPSRPSEEFSEENLAEIAIGKQFLAEVATNILANKSPVFGSPTERSASLVSSNSSNHEDVMEDQKRNSFDL